MSWLKSEFRNRCDRCGTLSAAGARGWLKRGWLAWEPAKLPRDVPSADPENGRARHYCPKCKGKVLAGKLEANACLIVDHAL